MYSHQFAAAIKVNDSVLRENKGSVAIPFGSEYKIHLKNMASVRAMVKVELDGTDVTEGVWLVIDPNSALDLERFIRNGNRNGGNRFKFIKRSGKVEEARGIKAEDGLVRIEYKFEKQRDPEVHTHHYDHYHSGYPWWWPSYTTTYLCNTGGSSVQNWDSNMVGDGGDINLSKCAGDPAATFTCSSVQPTGGAQGIGGIHTKGITRSAKFKPQGMSFNMSEASADPGITVAGSESHQQFGESGWFPTETQSYVLVLKLVGSVGGRIVSKPVTVKTKTRCTTCKTVNKSGVKFCRECGTALEII